MGFPCLSEFNRFGQDNTVCNMSQATLHYKNPGTRTIGNFKVIFYIH